LRRIFVWPSENWESRLRPDGRVIINKEEVLIRMMKVISIRKHFISIYFQHTDLHMHLDELKDGVFATDVNTRITADIITVFSDSEKWTNIAARLI